MKRLFALGMIVVATLVAAEEEPRHDLAYYTRAASEAYLAKDYAGFLDASLHAHELLPDHPRLMYNLACAYARNDRAGEAVLWLDRIAAMGLVYPASEDGDFASIRDNPGFRAVTARLGSNASPVHHAEAGFTIPEKGLVAEGIAHDPVGKAFYVSSVRKRKIVRIKDGKTADFIAGRDELWAALGLRVDSRRRRLWVTTAGLPQMLGFEAEDEGRSGLLEFDLGTGALRKARILPGKPEHHDIADLTLDSKGNVYVSDSITPAVYVVRGTGELTRLEIDAPFVSPQGVALSRDEKRLYVADYARGIFVVDLATLASRKLDHPESVCLHGIDGLVYANGALYATQNGIRPKRVVRIGLDPIGLRAERLDVLEASTPQLGEPTLGAVVDGWFYFIANSGWDTIDEKGNVPPDSELREHTILRVRL